MYFDADHFYGRILAVENKANKAFPDYIRGLAKVREMMANEPNIDVAPVVRCGECVKRNDAELCPMVMCEYISPGDKEPTWFTPTDGDGYCSYGKRKESEVSE